MPANIGAARGFLSWLFERACEDGYYLSVFAKRGEETLSLFFNEIEAAAEKCAALASTHDVYVNGAVFKTPPQSGRGSEDDTAGIVGLRVDMDYGKAGHSGKKKYPPTKESAFELLHSAGLDPSIVVASGNGLHGWWLFREPWLCLPPDESGTRRAIRNLARSWHATVKVLAASKGYALDSVFDLTRVLRVPGTTNWKDTQNPKTVEVMAPATGAPRRYSADDFEPLLVSEESHQHANGIYKFTTPVVPNPGLSVDAPPPKLALLCEADKKFSDTVYRRRKDLKDQSPSAYDMALSNLLVQAECTDQEIADILLWSRVKNNEKPEKALRRDYLMTTIGKARVAYEKARAQESAEILPPLPKDAPKEDKDDRRAKNTEFVNKTLGILIKQVIRHGTEDARYELVLEDGLNISIGDAGDMLNQETVRVKIFDQVGITIEMFKRPVWLKIASALRQLAETMQDEEATRMDKIFSWLRNYCFTHTLSTAEEENGEELVEQAISTQRPYIKGRYVYVNAPSLGKYLRSEQDEQADNTSLRQMMRLIGWIQVRAYGKRSDRSSRICRTYWRGPIKDVYDDYEERDTGELAGASDGEAPVERGIE